MEVECVQTNSGMRVTARLTAADLPRIEVIFTAIREMLEIDAEAEAIRQATRNREVSCCVPLVIPGRALKDKP